MRPFHHLRLISASLLFALALGCGAHKVILTHSPAVPAATGTVQVGHDDNGNSRIDLKVHHLAKPQNLNPPASTYVVWLEANGSRPQNLGQLQVGDDLSTEFKATTPEKTFNLFVTAENDARAQFPSGVEVLRSAIQR